MHTREYYALKGTGEFLRLAKATPVPNEYGVDLFAHRALDGSGAWTVTEGETGASFGEGETRQKAVNNALHNIEIRGMERVLSHMCMLLMKYGHSPRYKAA